MTVMRCTSSPLQIGQVIEGRRLLHMTNPQSQPIMGVVHPFWGEDSPQLMIRECVRVEVGDGSLYI